MPSIFMPPVVFDNPTVLPETRGLPRLLFRHYRPRPRGRTVLKIGGTYRTVDTPYGDLVDTATEVYLGGHEYVVSDTVAAALTAAGYGANLTAQPADPRGTWGQMAAFFWGEVAGYEWGSTP
jgi:hypothetical protein